MRSMRKILTVVGTLIGMVLVGILFMGCPNNFEEPEYILLNSTGDSIAVEDTSEWYLLEDGESITFNEPKIVNIYFGCEVTENGGFICWKGSWSGLKITKSIALIFISNTPQQISLD